MGYRLVINKFIIIILANVFLEMFLLFLGGSFLLMTFLMGLINLLAITFFCKKETRKQVSLLSLLLALFLTVIPILFAYLYGDAGAVTFMIVFTFFFVTSPLLLFSVLTFSKSKG